jgi:hypothetical protein
MSSPWQKLAFRNEIRLAGSFELKPASQASREYWAKSLAFSYNINE